MAAHGPGSGHGHKRPHRTEIEPVANAHDNWLHHGEKPHLGEGTRVREVKSAHGKFPGSSFTS